MTPSRPLDTIVIRGITLRRDPAREACFTIAHLHSEMWLSLDMSEVSRRERLHREFNQEVLSMEIAAQTLVDFPDVPWELRMHLGRQCWDESRHARLRYQRFLEIGGRKGEFPILNQEWGVVCVLDSLAARLAVQNRVFEGGALDGLRTDIEGWRNAGDERTAEITESVIADEIQHVRFGNEWLRRILKENPRALLEVASAMDFLKRVNAALSPQADDVSANGLELARARPHAQTSVEDRLAANFTVEEIEEVLRQEQEGR